MDFKKKNIYSYWWNESIKQSEYYHKPFTVEILENNSTVLFHMSFLKSGVFGDAIYNDLGEKIIPLIDHNFEYTVDEIKNILITSGGFQYKVNNGQWTDFNDNDIFTANNSFINQDDENVCCGVLIGKQGLNSGYKISFRMNKYDGEYISNLLHINFQCIVCNNISDLTYPTYTYDESSHSQNISWGDEEWAKLSMKPYELSGNIMSLLYGDDFKEKNYLSYIEPFSYFSTLSFYDIWDEPIFYDLTKYSKLQNIKNLILPAERLSFGCYRGMFSNCKELQTANKLPSAILHRQCYREMFWNCTDLTSFTTLPQPYFDEGQIPFKFQTPLGDNYNGMFGNCTSLNHIDEILIFESPEILNELNAPGYTFANTPLQNLIIPITIDGFMSQVKMTTTSTKNRLIYCGIPHMKRRQNGGWVGTGDTQLTLEEDSSITDYTGSIIYSNGGSSTYQEYLENDWDWLVDDNGCITEVCDIRGIDNINMVTGNMQTFINDLINRLHAFLFNPIELNDNNGEWELIDWIEDNINLHKSNNNITYTTSPTYYAKKPLTFNVIKTCEFEWGERKDDQLRKSYESFPDEYINPNIQITTDVTDDTYLKYLQYQINDGPWQDYKGKMMIPGGCKISWKISDNFADWETFKTNNLDKVKNWGDGVVNNYIMVDDNENCYTTQIENNKIKANTSTNGIWDRLKTPRFILITSGRKIHYQNTIHKESLISYPDHLGLFEIEGNPYSMISKDYSNITEVPFCECFEQMFLGVQELRSAKYLSLPPNILKPLCYQGMFEGCSNLLYTPQYLPAEAPSTICDGCEELNVTFIKYNSSGVEIDNVENIDENVVKSIHRTWNPWNRSGDVLKFIGDYNRMFADCIKIQISPIINANSLGTFLNESIDDSIDGFLSYMFYNCQNLQISPFLNLINIHADDSNTGLNFTFAMCRKLSVVKIRLYVRDGNFTQGPQSIEGFLDDTIYDNDNDNDPVGIMRKLLIYVDKIPNEKYPWANCIELSRFIGRTSLNESGVSNIYNIISNPNEPDYNRTSNGFTGVNDITASWFPIYFTFDPNYSNPFGINIRTVKYDDFSTCLFVDFETLEMINDCCIYSGSTPPNSSATNLISLNELVQNNTNERYSENEININTIPLGMIINYINSGWSIEDVASSIIGIDDNNKPKIITREVNGKIQYLCKFDINNIQDMRCIRSNNIEEADRLLTNYIPKRTGNLVLVNDLDYVLNGDIYKFIDKEYLESLNMVKPFGF